MTWIDQTIRANELRREWSETFIDRLIRKVKCLFGRHDFVVRTEHRTIRCTNCRFVVVPKWTMF